MDVRSRNRRVSMLSVRRKNFPKVERIVRSLTAERLAAARAELEGSGKTTDDGVKELLRSLSLYGYRQPMSRELRLSMRRKIQSLILHRGVPAIWFTLNPNDITNPVKLRLAAYRTRDPAAAEAFFFHREMTLFFEHYVRVGEESVFGRISHYYGAVETNERGALHVHGLLWLHGNAHLGSMLADIDGDDQAAYRERIVKYVDSVFSEDLDQEASCAIQAERSVTSDISQLLADEGQFSASFDEEANFCAGATQIHTHSPTCVKYSLGKGGRKGDLCRFKAPWALVDETAFTGDGVLRIRRSHSMVNRWNKAIAVGLRHNHDISFIATQRKTMALVLYVTNYATKVEDPVWKRVAAAADLLPPGAGDQLTEGAEARGDDGAGDDGSQNKTRQFLMKVANRVFTERPLSQVEVVADLLGYRTELTNSCAWAYLNVSLLYWHIFREWPHLRQESGLATADACVDESILVEEAGQRICHVEAYRHRGDVLGELCLYDYVSLVRLKRNDGDERPAAWGEVPFESGWVPGSRWVQVLRRPGKQATVCLDGYLSKDFDEDDEGSCYRRAAVQHLGLFVPWESFLGEGSGDINRIWARERAALAPRISCFVDNVQLLRRSAEDAKRDAKQWAASSGDGDATAVHADEFGTGEVEGETGSSYQADSAGNTMRLIDVVRSSIGANQITADSPELMAMMQELGRFQHSSSSSSSEFRATILPEEGPRRISIPGRALSGATIPPQSQVRAIKSQQISASREREKMIRGIQSVATAPVVDWRAAARSVLTGFGEDDIQMTAADLEETAAEASAGMEVRFGASTSFLEAGKALVARFTLNKKQAIAFLIMCRQLDLVRRSEKGNAGQLCQFVGGEGGTGKSRVIEALVELFASKDQSNRLLITATSGTAAARINGVTIHSACGFSKDLAAATNTAKDVDVVRLPQLAARRGESVPGRAGKMGTGNSIWQRGGTEELASKRKRDKTKRLPCEKSKGMDRGWKEKVLGDATRRRRPSEKKKGKYSGDQSGEPGVPDPAAVDGAHLPLRPQMEEATMMLNQGESAIRVRAVFMFVPGMPVVVNHNTHQGLKLVNGASYTAVEVIVDKAYLGHRVSADTAIHFGPPAGVILESETTRGLHFVGMPPGTVLLTPMTVKIQCQRKRPWQHNDVSRKGLPCAAAFACTDYKVQGRTLERVALELRGTRTSIIDGRAVSSQCDPYSLYVQLSRCPKLDGIMLISKVRERDLVGNRVPDEMTAAQAKLGQLSDETETGRQEDRKTGRQEDRKTGRQEDRKTGRQEDRKTGRQEDRKTGRQEDRKTGRQEDRKTGRQEDRKTGRQEDRKTGRQEDRKTGRQEDRKTGRQEDRKTGRQEDRKTGRQEDRKTGRQEDRKTGRQEDRKTGRQEDRKTGRQEDRKTGRQEDRKTGRQEDRKTGRQEDRKTGRQEDRKTGRQEDRKTGRQEDRKTGRQEDRKTGRQEDRKTGRQEDRKTGRQEDRKTGRQEDRKTGRQEDRKTGRQEDRKTGRQEDRKTGRQEDRKTGRQEDRKTGRQEDRKTGRQEDRKTGRQEDRKTGRQEDRKTGRQEDRKTGRQEDRKTGRQEDRKTGRQEDRKTGRQEDRKTGRQEDRKTGRQEDRKTGRQEDRKTGRQEDRKTGRQEDRKTGRQEDRKTGRQEDRKTGRQEDRKTGRQEDRKTGRQEDRKTGRQEDRKTGRQEDRKTGRQEDRKTGRQEDRKTGRQEDRKTGRQEDRKTGRQEDRKTGRQEDRKTGRQEDRKTGRQEDRKTGRQEDRKTGRQEDRKTGRQEDRKTGRQEDRKTGRQEDRKTGRQEDRKTGRQEDRKTGRQEDRKTGRQEDRKTGRQEDRKTGRQEDRKTGRQEDRKTGRQEDRKTGRQEDRKTGRQEDRKTGRQEDRKTGRQEDRKTGRQEDRKTGRQEDRKTGRQEDRKTGRQEDRKTGRQEDRKTGRQEDRKTGRQEDRKTGRQEDRKTGRQEDRKTGRQEDRKTGRQEDRKTGRQEDRKTGRQEDRKTGRQEDRKTGRQEDRKTGRQEDRKTGRQEDRKTGRQEDRKTGRQEDRKTGRQEDRKTGRQEDRKTGRQEDRKTGRQEDRKTGRQEDRKTGRQEDRKTGRQEDRKTGRQEDRKTGRQEDRKTGRQEDRKTGRQEDRKTGRQEDRKTGRQEDRKTGRQEDRKTGRQEDRKTGRQEDRKTGRQEDRKTGRQEDRKTGRQEDRKTGRQEDRKTGRQEDRKTGRQEDRKTGRQEDRKTGRQEDRKTGRQEDRKTGRQEDRKTGRQEDRKTGRQEDRKTGRQEDRKTGRQEDRKTGRQEDRKTGRQEDRKTGRQEDRKTGRQEDRKTGRQEDRKTGRQEDRKTGRQEDRKTGRQEDRKTGRQEDRKTGRQEDRKTGRQEDRKTGRQEDRKTGRQEDRKTGRQEDRKTGRQEDRKTGRQEDRKTGRQEDRKTGRQEDRKTGRQEDRKTGRQEDRKTGRQEDRKTGRQEDRKTGRQEDRKPEDGDRGDTAAAGDVPGIRSRKGSTLRPIQPKEPVFDKLRGKEQLAAAIASGLPKRRRGRSWRGKGVPSRRGFSNAAGTAQHSGSPPVGDSGADAGVDDAAAEPADASLSGRRPQQREVGGSSAAAVAEPVLSGRQRLPQQGRREYRKGQGLTRLRLRMENVRQHGTRPVQCHEPEGASGDAHVVGQSSPKLAYPTACEEANQPTREEITDPGRPRKRQKRGRLPSRDERPRKEVRSGVGRERRRELQAEELGAVLQVLEEDFAMKESLSNSQMWCTPIPHERKVSTVRDFYQAFHDASTLPIRTCMLCYRKCTRKELREITWGQRVSSCVPKGGRSPFSCRSCFPEGESVSVCAECARCLARGSLSPAIHLHSRLGCEHMFPDELKGLTPVEEKLISLNSCYGFVTRYSIPGGQRQGVRYPRHVKGHITVFPNNVQELATKVLPHPLLQALDEIHVSWQGAEKPAPSDLSSLLSVRRRVVERALTWLKRNNPHYAEIEIDAAEMESWGDSIHGVPALVYDRMERNEPSAWEKTRTAHVVPPTERALDDEGSVEIDQLFALLNQRQETDGEAERQGPNEEGADRDGIGAGPDQNVEAINEVTSSAMFALDGPPDVVDVEKLRFACDAIGEGADESRAGPRTWVGSSAAGARGRGDDGSEPYIRVSRGDEFADSFETSFFARTFPTLFPFGVGGPRLLEETIAEAGKATTDLRGRAVEAEAAARDSVSSRSLNLRVWADIVLRRHGGRFALHHIFAFLVFNMGVRSRNRRVSMLSVTRRNFRTVERIVRSMTAERLAAARVELESSGKTTDDGVKELLRSLSLYGHRQPMSREVRLNMRRKIQSLIVGYGVPAIWFTINPNDITNPVKLRLAAYRTRDPDAAEEFLEGLGNAYKRTRLAISDPMSSAVFFHREMKLFFDHYVKVGEESVFGRISKYYGAVEVIAHLLGYPAEFTNSSAWAYLNTSLLYWEVFRRWPHLRQASGAADTDDTLDESVVVVEEAGLRISHVEAYQHRGELLRGLCLYDYISLVRLKRICKEAASCAGWGEVPFEEDGWAPGGRRWVQVLRRPGKHATVCLDGYLSKDFGHDDEESCHRRCV
ncbi:hypothetical protein HIM_10727 [Hirsutella minnesotensis 3608]|uniref:ATP-dependent DNA helicase n=1 Tax=Hirsutella minnesotensis 3608 TaxID=1043627 RepID=A0A0F8A1Z7_9HYPO|nr:hypothetical protein HIM_10727 [Hirsutella minnesotensis 3608]